MTSNTTNGNTELVITNIFRGRYVRQVGNTVSDYNIGNFLTDFPEYEERSEENFKSAGLLEVKYVVTSNNDYFEHKIVYGDVFIANGVATCIGEPVAHTEEMRKELLIGLNQELISIANTDFANNSLINYTFTSTDVEKLLNILESEDYSEENVSFMKNINNSL